MKNKFVVFVLKFYFDVYCYWVIWKLMNVIFMFCLCERYKIYFFKFLESVMCMLKEVFLGVIFNIFFVLFFRD